MRTEIPVDTLEVHRDAVFAFPLLRAWDWTRRAVLRRWQTLGERASGVGRDPFCLPHFSPARAGGVEKLEGPWPRVSVRTSTCRTTRRTRVLTTQSPAEKVTTALAALDNPLHSTRSTPRGPRVQVRRPATSLAATGHHMPRTALLDQPHGGNNGQLGQQHLLCEILIRAKAGGVCLAFIAIGFIAGCSSSEGSGSADGLSAAQVAERYGYDVESAAETPVFAIVAEYKDPRDGYARDLLAQRCLQGVVQYRPVRLGEQGGVLNERTGQPVFNEQIAAQWGYSALRLNPPSDGALRNDLEITPELSAAMEACGREADKRLGRPPSRLLEAVETAGWEALPGSEELNGAAARWRDCMQPAGVIDLPTTPEEMPPASVLTPGSEVRSGDDLVATADIPPTAREINVAVLDARCREESNYSAVRFRVRANAELAAIGRSVEEFDAAMVEYVTYMQKVDQVIAELG